MSSARVLRRRQLLSIILLALSALAVSIATPAPSQACGGFFCSQPPAPDVPPEPIYQAGERVIFAFDEDNDRVTMHLEIAYSGESTNFAWLLPIPALPQGEGGDLPLEQVLGISSTSLFDQLQAATDPKFDVDWRVQSSCGAQLLTGIDDVNQSNASGDEPLNDRDGEHEIQVRVRDEASVGPYEAQLIEATDTDALYEWLAERGYFQDPKASALLSDYVKMDYKFLALRLRKGVEPGEIRPISLKIAMTSACVPLRLTSIAALEHMPILVWVLGNHRAIPKNFLHARVNPRALEWPGAPNYLDTVTKAVDTSAGRAFVTEYAGAEKIMDGLLYNSDTQTFEQGVEASTDFQTLLTWVLTYYPAFDADLRMAMSAHISMPDGLRGYPNGDCLQMWRDRGSVGAQPSCESNDSHVTTPAEYYGYLNYWMGQLGGQIEIDSDGLRAELLEVYFPARRDAQALLDEAPWITRFFTTISSPEMTRDPVFGFNAELAPISNESTTRARAVSDSLCRNWELQVTYPDGSKDIVPCSETNCTDQTVIRPIAGEDALYQVEVVDEWGVPRPFDPATSEEVDEAIGDAAVGEPTLPPDYELTLPPCSRAPLWWTADQSVWRPGVQRAGAAW